MTSFNFDFAQKMNHVYGRAEGTQEFVFFWDEDIDTDVRKFSFGAKHVTTHEKFDVDHSPYELPTFEAMLAYVCLGFPKRKGVGPWKNETIVEELVKQTGQARADNLVELGA